MGSYVPGERTSFTPSTSTSDRCPTRDASPVSPNQYHCLARSAHSRKSGMRTAFSTRSFNDPTLVNRWRRRAFRNCRAFRNRSTTPLLAISEAGARRSKRRASSTTPLFLNRPFDDGEILDILRRLSVERPNMTYTELQHEHLATSLHRWYGGVTNAVRAAGIENWPVRVHFPRMSRNEVRRALRRRLANGEPIDRGTVSAEDPNLAYSIKMVHPEWTEALARLELGRAVRPAAPSRPSD